MEDKDPADKSSVIVSSSSSGGSALSSARVESSNGSGMAADSTSSNGVAVKASSTQAAKSNGKQAQSSGGNNAGAGSGHQFRAPENSVSRHYRRSGGCHTIATVQGSNKKSKSWSKRQNKNNNNNTGVGAGNGGNGGNGHNKAANLASVPAATGAPLTATANLENIQENRCSGPGGTGGVTGKNSHNRHHHTHDGAGGEGRPVNGQRLMSLNKKSMSHRSNHKIIGGVGLSNGSGCNGGVGGGGNGAGGNGDTTGGVIGIRLKDSVILGVNNMGGNLVNGNVAVHLKNHCCLRSKFFLADKRPRKDNFIPPTKFLLGGNVSDPRNLNSLQNEPGDCSSNDGDSNGRTPRRSPITTPPKVEVIIPPNIHDPLHLLDPVDSIEYEKQLTSPMKKEAAFVQLGGSTLAITRSGACLGGHGGKHRNRKNRKLKRRRHESQNSVLGAGGLQDHMGPPASLNQEDAIASKMVDDQLPSQQAAELQKSLAEGEGGRLPETAGGMEMGMVRSDLAVVKDQHKEKATGEDKCKNQEEQIKEGLDGDEKSANVPEYPANGCFGGRKRKVSESHSCTSLKLKKFRLDVKDRIVSPVVPQPGTWKRPIHTVSSYNAMELNSANRKNTSQMKFAKDLEMDSGKSGGIKHLAGEKVIAEGGSQCIGVEEPRLAASADSLERRMQDCVGGRSTATTMAKDTQVEKEGGRMPLRFSKRGGQYRYGNYNRHADVRHVNESMDVRLQVFHRFPELFANKDVLDIGCNVGYMTTCIAKRFAPKSILGIDIDRKLIDQARHNLGMCVRIPNDKIEEVTMLASSSAGNRQQRSNAEPQTMRGRTKVGVVPTSIQPDQLFPISFPISLGGIVEEADDGGRQSVSTVATPNRQRRNPAKSTQGGGKQVSGNTFPRNVSFRCCNYVLKDESLLAHDVQQYDLILCLSVTKWIHLNFGDSGLKLAFKRMFNQLRPGGKLILEAQNWTSYKKKKKLNETIYNNFNNIEFFPNKFREYLLSSEVGFSHSYTLGVPKHMNKGFCRPIQLYAKGDYTPNHVRWSDAYCPQTPYEAYRGIYATQPPSQRGGGGGGGGRSTHMAASSIRSLNMETPHYSGVGGSQQTPLHQANTSQYYNPLETDSYLPSYDMDYLSSMYVFASPLYQTVWSPPASMRNGSACQTPLFGGSVHDPDWAAEGGGDRRRHVYLPNEENAFGSLLSPTVNTTSAFNSIREPDQEADEGSGGGGGGATGATQQRRQHVYPPNYGEHSPYSTTLNNASFAAEGNLAPEAFYLDDDVRESFNRSGYQEQEMGDGPPSSGQQTPTNN